VDVWVSTAVPVEVKTTDVCAWIRNGDVTFFADNHPAVGPDADLDALLAYANGLVDALGDVIHARRRARMDALVAASEKAPVAS